MKVAVVGIGHVGLVVAACVAEMGHDVIGVDLPPNVEALNQGITTFFEPELDAKVAKMVKERRLCFTTQLEEVRNSQVIWICIGTEQTPDGDININIIERIIAEIGKICLPSTLIALKSTLPIGACRYLFEQLPDDGPILVNNPEFLRQGSAVYDFFHPGKTVIGIGPRGGAEVFAELYEPLPGPRIITNWETAEMIKLAQNTFNALHISFMNELSLTLEGLDISLEQVSQALRNDLPALQRYLNPGFSYGGSCLPNNVAYLNYLARSREYTAPLLYAIKTVNDLRISLLVDKIARNIGGIDGRRIAFWGLTYKAGTDDVRDSPSIWLANRLQSLGAKILVYDPLLQAAQIEGFNLIFCPSIQESLTSVQALVALTRSPEFSSVPANIITDSLDTECIFDMVGALPQLREGK